MFNFDRNELRKIYFTSWQKYHDKQVLEPLENQIVEIILMHPEYHEMFNNPDNYLEEDYTPESGQTNPFLHLSLHMGIQEQIKTNRPQGIKKLYEKLCKKMQTKHQAEHAMMQCLAEMIWEVQRSQQLPDEKKYWEDLQKLL